jgi:hypothetical protein
MEAEPREWHSLYFNAFDALQFDRFYGALGGQGPISYRAIRDYAIDHGIDGADIVLFHAFMTALDAVYLDIVAKQHPDKQ